MSESVQQKADRYLTEGRVRVVRVTDESAYFEVWGSRSTPYKVHGGADWLCNCEARVPDCAHIKACRKVVKLSAPKIPQLVDPGDDLTSLLTPPWR